MALSLQFTYCNSIANFPGKRNRENAWGFSLPGGDRGVPLDAESSRIAGLSQCTVQREKTLRRVGLRKRSPPAAGEGWLAVPCGSQRRKRAALGVTFGPGRSGIHPAPLFAAAGRSAQEPVQRADEGFGPYGDTVGPVHFL